MNKQSSVVFLPKIQTLNSKTQRIYPLLAGIFIVITSFSFWQINVLYVLLFGFLGVMMVVAAFAQTKQSVIVGEDSIEISVPLSTTRVIRLSELAELGYARNPWWISRARHLFRLVYRYKNGRSAWMLMNVWSPEELEEVVDYVCKKFPSIKRI